VTLLKVGKSRRVYGGGLSENRLEMFGHLQGTEQKRRTGVVIFYRTIGVCNILEG